MSTEPIECPICFDEINQQINCITTECGHKFHANCIMRNVAQNGFGCPCCRSKMADEVEGDSDTDSDGSESDDGSDSDDSDDSSSESDELYDDYVLRGLRLFTNMIEGEENYEEDIEAEYVLSFENDYEGSDDTAVKVPTAEYITERLLQQGVTMYQLVHTLMIDNEEYDKMENVHNSYNELSVKVRELIDEFIVKNNEMEEEEKHQEEEPQEQPDTIIV